LLQLLDRIFQTPKSHVETLDLRPIGSDQITELHLFGRHRVHVGPSGASEGGDRDGEARKKACSRAVRFFEHNPAPRHFHYPHS